MNGFILLKMKTYLSSYITLQVCKVSSVIGCFSCRLRKAVVQSMKLWNQLARHFRFLHKEGEPLDDIAGEMTVGSASSHSYPPASHVGICNHKQHAAFHFSCKTPVLQDCSRFEGEGEESSKQVLKYLEGGVAATQSKNLGLDHLSVVWLHVPNFLFGSRSKTVGSECYIFEFQDLMQ